ncbi:MAG: hypothetical protein HRU28_01610 [Rhizobiales bacterium]|nr:hypothetical protein [Hyphomicrobiales bacterium]
MTYTQFSKLRTLCAVLASATLLSVTPTFAEDPKPSSQHKEWSVFSYSENGKKVCFAVTPPLKTSLAVGARRGEIFFRITHRQSDKTTNAIGISMGYPIKADSTPTATIGGKIYSFFAQGQETWPAGQNVEKQLLAAMKRGSKMVVKAVSTRGTKTTDTYSLSGITAAISASKKLCKL